EVFSLCPLCSADLLFAEVHHRWIRTTNEADEIESVLFDKPDCLSAVGFAGLEIYHQVVSVNHRPPSANLLGLDVGVTKRERILSGERTVRHTAADFEIHHQLFTGRRRAAHVTDPRHAVKLYDVSGLLGVCRFSLEVHNPVGAIDYF